MIDWFNLAGNALWILGCALALGTLSFASWQASIRNERLRHRLANSNIQAAFNAAGMLFCAGLAATSETTLEIVLWSVLGVLFLIQGILGVRQKFSHL
jgi:hypothetical protein